MPPVPLSSDPATASEGTSLAADTADTANGESSRTNADHLIYVYADTQEYSARSETTGTLIETFRITLLTQNRHRLAEPIVDSIRPVAREIAGRMKPSYSITVPELDREGFAAAWDAAVREAVNTDPVVTVQDQTFKLIPLSEYDFKDFVDRISGHLSDEWEELFLQITYVLDGDQSGKTWELSHGA